MTQFDEFFLIGLNYINSTKKKMEIPNYKSYQKKKKDENGHNSSPFPLIFILYTSFMFTLVNCSDNGQSTNKSLWI